MNTLNLVKTNTTKFILPMVFNDDVQYTDILKEDFINTYISDYYKPEYDSSILIVKNDNTQPENTNTNLVISYENDLDWVFVYDVPEKWEPDYLLVMQGEYPSMSDEYKKKILKFWKQDEESLLYKMLYVEKKLYQKYKFRILNEMYKIDDESLP